MVVALMVSNGMPIGILKVNYIVTVFMVCKNHLQKRCSMCNVCAYIGRAFLSRA